MRRNAWLDRRVLNYAHQGGAREGPSSTLFAMRQALAAGATALEMDVHRTSDGHLVVCHDATVDRTTDGSGRIADLTLAEVLALDNAYWFVPGSVVDHSAAPEAYVHRGKAADDPEYRIPTLIDVLEAFPDTYLNLDIKTTKPDVPYEAQLGELLVDHGRVDDVIVASFHDSALDDSRHSAPASARHVVHGRSPSSRWRWLPDSRCPTRSFVMSRSRCRLASPVRM